MGLVGVWARWRPFGVDSVRLVGSKKSETFFKILTSGTTSFVFVLMYRLSYWKWRILGDFPKNLEMTDYTAPCTSDFSTARRLLINTNAFYDHKNPISSPKVMLQHAEVLALRFWKFAPNWKIRKSLDLHRFCIGFPIENAAMWGDLKRFLLSANGIRALYTSEK